MEDTSSSEVPSATKAACARVHERFSASGAVVIPRQPNSPCLISHLPSELLEIIFIFVAGTVRYGHPRLRWIRVSYVCSHWRRVALDCPNLWTRIPFSYPTWAQEMLTRSKMAALTVDVKIGDGSYEVPYGIADTLVKGVLRNLSRIGNLSLSQLECNNQKFMEFISLLNVPAPLLETCRISFNRTNDNNRLPACLFSGESPRLTQLTLSNCDFSWGAIIFLSTLRFLKVCDSSLCIGRPADQFISALSNMPCLESLIVVSDFASMHGPSTGDSRSNANLPRLQELVIQSSLPNCVFLLNHIIYSKTPRVTITCAGYPAFEVDTRANLMEGLVRNLGERVEGPIRSMPLHCRQIKLWTSSGISDPYDRAIFPQVDLNLGYSWDLKSTKSVLTALSLTCLESLIVTDILLQEAIWVIFGSLRRLRNIHVSYRNDGFLKALSKGLFEEEVTQAIDVNFKALRRLSIDNTIVDELYRDASNGFQSTYIEVLSRYLSARQENGIVLSELILKMRDHIPEADVKNLESIVKRVDVRRYTSPDNPSFQKKRFPIAT
ncbi:hypothetical protein FPV67DRAFT_1101678 [Lyophyllum atratum]|nr:hypothetical protein FPV67DRAFT_1101678 [Lyophyllum atratum]